MVAEVAVALSLIAKTAVTITCRNDTSRTGSSSRRNCPSAYVESAGKMNDETRVEVVESCQKWGPEDVACCCCS